MASIRKLPSGRWRVRWRDPSGKEYGETFRVRRDAVARKAAVEVELSRGSVPDPSTGRQTLASFLGETTLGGDLRPATRAKYDVMRRRYIDPNLGSRTLASIRPADLRRLYERLSAGGVGVATVEAVHRLLSRGLRQAFREGLIPSNPAAAVSATRAKRKPLRIPTMEEVNAVLGGMDGRFQALVYLAATSGARIGELLALRIPDLDLERGIMRISRAVSESRGQVVEGETKTAGSRRSVVLDRRTCEALAGHLVGLAEDHRVGGSSMPHHAEARRSPARRTRWRKDWDNLPPDHLLFPSARCGLLPRTRFTSRYWRPAVKVAGVEGLRFHDLRHYSASRMMQERLPAKAIQERLGHSTVRTTFDVYGHLLPGSDSEMRERLEGIFGGTFVARTDSDGNEAG